MASPRPLLDLTLREWLDELAAANAAPGGGSALGFAVASAAAVLAMAARLSRETWDAAGGAAAQAEALLARTAVLAQLDADVYLQALEVRGTSSSLRPDQRDFEIGRAFAAAAEPPLEIARAAADVAVLAAELAEHGDERVRADAVAAGALAAAAARGAVALVAVNLTTVDRDPRLLEARSLAAVAEDAAAQAARA